MQLGFSVEQQRQWVEENRPKIEAKTGAPVLAFSVFYRSGSWGAMGAQHLSPLAASAIKMIGKRKASGLPAHFILAVTADRIFAFAYKSKRRGIEVGDELMVWNRPGVRVSAEETSLTVRLTIDAPNEETKVVCDTGKAAITDSFMTMLGLGGSLATAAA
jgi:hypothetical protein